MLGLSLPGFSTDPSGTISFQYQSSWTNISEINLNNFGISWGSPIENNQRSIFGFNAEDADFILLDTYKDFHISELEQINVIGHRVNFIEYPTDTTLSEIPAFQIQYINPLLGGIHAIEITAIKDGKLYTASYRGQSDAFQKHLDSFHKIVNTIKIG